MSVGEWIKDGRTGKGWSQEKLARESNVGLRRISAYERGENEPSLKHLAALASALGKPLPWSDRATARLFTQPEWTRPEVLAASG